MYKIIKSESLTSLINDLFSKWKYEEIISDIGHAFHDGYFFSDTIILKQKNICNLKFNEFLDQYEKVWKKRDFLNKKILNDLKYHRGNLPDSKLLEYLSKLNKSLYDLIGYLGLIDVGNIKNGYLKKYEKQLKSELETIKGINLLKLLNMNNDLSFYNFHIIELYRLRKKLSSKLINKIDSKKDVIFENLRLKDKRSINSFLNRYYHHNQDYLYFKLRSISFFNDDYITNILSRHARKQLEYKKQLKIIKKTINDKTKLKRIMKYLKDIQKIFYYEHIYEQKRRINISLGLGDILIRYLIVRRMNLSIKSPLRISQKVLEENFKLFIYGNNKV